MAAMKAVSVPAIHQGFDARLDHHVRPRQVSGRDHVLIPIAGGDSQIGQAEDLAAIGDHGVHARPRPFHPSEPDSKSSENSTPAEPAFPVVPPRPPLPVVPPRPAAAPAAPVVPPRPAAAPAVPVVPPRPAVAVLPAPPAGPPPVPALPVTPPLPLVPPSPAVPGAAVCRPRRTVRRPDSGSSLPCSGTTRRTATPPAAAGESETSLPTYSSPRRT